MTNHTLQKRLLRTGAVLAATSVILGAFGAHALKEKLSAYDLQVFETGVRYQFFHVFGILFIAAILRKLNEKTALIASRFFIAGIAIFSGSLYILSTRSLWIGDDIKWIGMITPIGGVCFILGWLLLAFKGYKDADEIKRLYK